ncbi:sensor histidine kinase [Mycobacterium sp.]|uniref:sensor histidine kinase n=1 Tax=Mycobacterium sp. TaxID=1785 RepID=UPI002BD7B617|nr:sensor histidine kinase [Mycobacterium sp.]HKP39721.1 sensor histidine kinase [Mycobacterium sp.]
MERVRDELRRPAVWLVPLVVAGIQLAGTAGPRHRRFVDPHWLPLNWFGYLLLIAGPLTLLLRTLYPYAVLLAVLAITVVYKSAGFGYGPIFVSLIVAFLTAAAVGPRWRTYPLPLVGWVAVVWLIPLLRGEAMPPAVVSTGIAAWLLVLLAAAEGIRQRRAVLDARRQRKAAMAREARAEQERRASQARLSIARELHDVLAHSLSMINVQSSVALELLGEHPERAGPALAAIKEASRQAISDVHSLVTALRAENGQPTAPTPGIADLDGLVGTARTTGLTVTTAVRGEPRPLPAVIDVAAARIVQESLTNVVRHSTAENADVTVTYGTDQLDVAVDNDGRPLNASPSSGGSGITGMTERARALGGDLSVRRQPGGGFSVRATLPIESISGS